MKIKSIILVLICLLNITNASSQGSDDSLLTQYHCHFPCWYDLIPGESTFLDVIQTLPQIEFIFEAKQIRSHTYKSIRYDKTTTTTLRWWYESVTETSRLHIDDFYLTEISIYPNIEFTLQEILSFYGIPEAILLNSYYEHHMGILFIELLAYYPQMGLIVMFEVNSDTPESTSIPLDLTLPGTYFSLYKPSDNLEQFITHISVYPPDHESTIDRINRLHCWDENIEIQIVSVYESTYFAYIPQNQNCQVVP